MKKLSIALFSIALAASCSSSKTETQPDEEVKETTEVTETETEEAMTPDAVIVEAHAKYSAGDMEAAMAYMAEGSTWEEAGHPAGPMAASDALAGFKKSISDMTVAPHRIFVAADAGITVTQGVLKGTNDGPLAKGTPATNKPVGNDFLHIQWWNDEGKIAKTWAIGNSTTVPKMAGLMPVAEGTAPPAVSDWPSEPEVVVYSENQANLDLTAQQIEAAVEGDFDTYKANMADSYGGASYGTHNLDTDKAAAVAWLQMMHKSFSDASAENVHAWSFDDFVVSVDVISMKHTGAMGPIKATNKEVTQHYVTIYKFEDGKIVWGESYSNPMELMSQIMPKKEDATAMNE